MITLETERLAYSIDEFCRLVGVSRAFWYQMPEADKPRSVKRGQRVLIPADVVKEWLGTNVAA